MVHHQWVAGDAEPDHARHPAVHRLQRALGCAIDNTAHGVSVALTGLTPGAGYCVELVAVNGSATTPSSPLTFTAGFPFTITTSSTD